MTLSLLLFGSFVALMAAAVPLAVALGLAATAAILLANLGIMALPTNAYTGIAKYPLLAIPVFVLAGMIFERSGVALRLVRLASAIVGERTGGLAVVAVLVCMIMGGISGSGPADAAAVATVMIPSMARAGYPLPFAASVIGAGAATAILIPPSIGFIVYSVYVPQATVPSLFAAGMVPGILAGLSLLVPILWLSRRGGFGAEARGARPPLLKSLRDAVWGLLAPVIILGGMRTGVFTPTEAAVVAVFYGLVVGIGIYRAIDLRTLYELMVDAAVLSAVIMIIIALASVFAWAGSTLGAFDAAANAVITLAGGHGLAAMIMLNVLLLFAGMFLDAVSIFLILLPLLVTIAQAFDWNLVWFGVVITMNLAIGQFTPPLAVNLMVTTRVAGVSLESTVPWVLWLVAAMVVALGLVIVFPELALWLPRQLDFPV